MNEYDDIQDYKIDWGSLYEPTVAIHMGWPEHGTIVVRY